MERERLRATMQELRRRAVHNFPGSYQNQNPRAQGAQPSFIPRNQRASHAEDGLANATPAYARPEPRFRQPQWERVPESRVLWRPRHKGRPDPYNGRNLAPRASGSGNDDFNPRMGRPLFPERRPMHMRNVPVRTSASAHEWSRPLPDELTRNDYRRIHWLEKPARDPSEVRSASTWRRAKPPHALMPISGYDHPIAYRYAQVMDEHPLRLTRKIYRGELEAP